MTPPIVQRRLAAAVLPFVVATIVGVLLLWPSGDFEPTGVAGAQGEQLRATVTRVDPGGCEAPAVGADLGCTVVTARLDEASLDGESFTFDYSTGPNSRGMEEGDEIFVGKTPEGQEGPPYFFLDYNRRFPLLVLVVLFAVVVVALSRWHGLFSLVGVGISLGVLLVFVMPAILEGSNPVAVSIAGAALIMFANLYLAHGFNARTTTAILGTMGSLGLTGILAIVFVEFAKFTGFGSEEAAFLQISADQVNLEGLLLGGIIIGTLGVLDDVTITQASAVWELRAANPSLGFIDLYRSGIRIGRDHIASTVNTLVLAYAGASLPLLVLFSVSQRPLLDIVNSEVVAEEVVRTLVGSVGLVASVPVTTALAARVVAATGSGRRAAARSRHEREWRGDEDDSTESEFWETVAPPADAPADKDSKEHGPG